MTFQKGNEPSNNGKKADNDNNDKSGSLISESRSDKSFVSNISKLAKRNELQYQ